jgi:hypothetical protein
MGDARHTALKAPLTCSQVLMAMVWYPDEKPAQIAEPSNSSALAWGVPCFGSSMAGPIGQAGAIPAPAKVLMPRSC